MIGLLILASIPAGVLGLLFKDLFESVFATPMVAGVALFVTAGLLVGGQKFERSDLSLPYEELPFAKAFLIGLFQAAALVPGISRSGSTISGGLISGLKRDSAAAFSFLMAIPVIGGAALIKFKDVLTGEVVLESGQATPLLAGGVSIWALTLRTCPPPRAITCPPGPALIPLHASAPCQLLRELLIVGGVLRMRVSTQVRHAR